MPKFRVNGHLVHMKLTGRRDRRPQPCVAIVEPEGAARYRCLAFSTRLCDWPVEGGTCSAPVCAEHATSAGPDLDYCPIHAKKAAAT